MATSVLPRIEGHKTRPFPCTPLSFLVRKVDYICQHDGGGGASSSKPMVLDCMPYWLYSPPWVTRCHGKRLRSANRRSSTLDLSLRKGIGCWDMRGSKPSVQYPGQVPRKKSVSSSGLLDSAGSDTRLS